MHSDTKPEVVGFYYSFIIENNSESIRLCSSANDCVIGFSMHVMNLIGGKLTNNSHELPVGVNLVSITPNAAFAFNLQRHFMVSGFYKDSRITCFALQIKTLICFI